MELSNCRLRKIQLVKDMLLRKVYTQKRIDTDSLLRKDGANRCEYCISALRGGGLKALLDRFSGVFCLVYKFSSLEVFKEKPFNFFSTPKLLNSSTKRKVGVKC